VISAASRPAAIVSLKTSPTPARCAGASASQATANASAPNAQLVASSSLEVSSCAAMSPAAAAMNAARPIRRSSLRSTASTASGGSAISIRLAWPTSSESS